MRWVYARPVGRPAGDVLLRFPDLRPPPQQFPPHRPRRGLTALALALLFASEGAARAQATQTTPAANAGAQPPNAEIPPAPEAPAPTAPTPLAPSLSDSLRFAQDLEKTPPPPSNVVYFQYGVAFTTEQIVAAGPTCDSTTAPCILGAGGGIVVRGGWRSTGPLYVGIAYELTKQDPNKLYRIALLQQARAEARYYFTTARVTEPYASVSGGVGGYGNEWAVDAWGPGGSIGGGIEYQITRRTVVGLGLAYRLLYLSRFTDTAGTDRAGGVAQLFGLDLVLEQRDAIVTDGADDARPR